MTYEWVLDYWVLQIRERERERERDRERERMEADSRREKEKNKEKNKEKSEKSKPPFVIAKDDTKPVLQDPVNVLLFPLIYASIFSLFLLFLGCVNWRLLTKMGV